MTEIRIARISHEDISRLFIFRNKYYNNDRQARVDKWEWMFKVYSINERIPFFVIKSNDDIVGTIGYIKVRIKYKNSVLEGSVGADFHVEEKYHGIYPVMLIKKITKENEIIIGFDLSRAARKLFDKLGFVDYSNDVYQYSIILKSNNNLRHSILGHIKHGLINIIGQVYVSSGDEYNAMHFDVFPDDAKYLWEYVADGIDISIIKDFEYLKWRYGQCPGSNYKYICLFKKKIIVGMMIYLHNVNNINEVLIMDIISNPNVAEDNINLIIRSKIYFMKNNVNNITTHIKNKKIEKYLTLTGFSKTSSGIGLMIFSKNADKHYSNYNEFVFSLGDSDRH